MWKLRLPSTKIWNNRELGQTLANCGLKTGSSPHWTNENFVVRVNSYESFPSLFLSLSNLLSLSRAQSSSDFKINSEFLEYRQKRKNLISLLWRIVEEIIKKKIHRNDTYFFEYPRKEENFYFFNGVLFYYEFFINSFRLKHSFTLCYNLCPFYKINYDVQCDNDVT